MTGFVDVHSHVVPSGDDGAATVGEGLALCREAASRGTTVLYATPHVWAGEGLDREREASVRRAHAAMARDAAGFGLDLRLGFELTPSPELLEEDLGRYVLEGMATPSVLIELPFRGPIDLVLAVAEHAEALGLRPILAHPERADAVLDDPGQVEPLLERDWLLQLNATSLLGYHGGRVFERGWQLLETGAASLVASDGHRPARPPFLDEAHRAVRARLGIRADALFDGSALGEIGQAPARESRPYRLAPSR
jgi:protein-tyrosine phosphatase